MPPLLPQDSDNILVTSPEPYYTNEDVAILHDIVVHAQELLPSLPERERLPTNALFHAYYSILPSIGIDADHDSRYARILFKIGGTRNDGSLYEKFEAVLARMGIEIQFDQVHDFEGEDGATEEGFDQGSEIQVYTGSAPTVADQSRGRKRSNSENPPSEPGHRYMEDSLRRRASSSMSTAHSENIVNRIIYAPNLSRDNRQLSTQNPPQTASQDGKQGNGKDYSLRAWLNDNFGKYSQRTRTRSSSTHGSMRIRRRSLSAMRFDIKTTSVSHLPWAGFSAEGMDQQKNLHNERLNQSKTFAPTLEVSVDARVSLLRKLYMENWARQILSRWHQETLQLQEDNKNLETLAKHQDRRVLLRQAFDSWHVGLGERRHIAETDRFFAHLERRAGRARDLFLMAKALTHWAYSASNEIQRTSAARRHILRIRYFSAWRDTTAVDELKVRRHVLRKYFSIWQGQRVIMLLNNEKAILHFTDNLVQRIFWAWFWAFCERKAPVWRSNRLLGKQMALWTRAISQRKKERNAAVDCYHQNAKRKTYSVWSTKAQEHAMQILRVNEYQTVSLCHKALGVWRHISALLPRLQYIYRKVDSRLKYNTLKLWILRARQESHSRAIDQSKILREAWVTWNDKLRCRSLQSRINDRIVLQGLYKWVLGERLVLMRRLMERRMMQTSIKKIAETLQRSTAKESRDIYLAQETFIRRLIVTAIRNWRIRLNNNLQRQYAALNFNSHLTLWHSLTRWSGQSQRVGDLQTWAHDGEFYFLASKTIKAWKNATENTKREKRRLAYAQFRRRHKVGLASKVFLRWHQQATSIIQSDRSATGVYQNKAVMFCPDAFNRWRARMEEIAELNVVRERFVLNKHLKYLKQSLVNRRALEVEATVFFEEYRVALCMKKWGRVYLQLRARHHLVFELQEKHLKRTSRRVLAHWLQRTWYRHRLPGTGDHKKNEVGSLEGMVSWIESIDDHIADEWLEGANNGTGSPLMPGYLSTPSRRMSRAKTTTRLPSTTPSAPLSTPVERQLRAQYSGGPLPSFRRRIGRSLLGRGETPFDLEEEFKIETHEEAIEE